MNLIRRIFSGVLLALLLGLNGGGAIAAGFTGSSEDCACCKGQRACVHRRSHSAGWQSAPSCGTGCTLAIGHRVVGAEAAESITASSIRFPSPVAVAIGGQFKAFRLIYSSLYQRPPPAL